MNRSLLLVVCDFLLLSIISLARFDVPPDAILAKDDEKIVHKEVIERVSDGENYDDVVAELEATNETLEANLNQDKDTLQEEKLRLESEIAERRRELEEKEALIAQKDEVISENKEDIEEAARLAAQLEKDKADIERRREDLLARNAAAKKELEVLAANLNDAKKKADELAAAKERTEKEAADARVDLARAEEIAKAKTTAASKAEENLVAERERADALVETTAKLDDKITALDSGIREVGSTVKSVNEDLAGVRETVQNVSEEVAGVGDKVQTVTDNVVAIQQNVAETAAEQKEALASISVRQAKSLNEIYTKYESNKVSLSMTFRHKGGFLGAEKSETFETDTIILAEGAFAYALVHAKNSPFRLEPTPRKLLEVSGTITGTGISEPIAVNEVAFMDDPRILIVPLYVNPRELEAKNSIKFFNAPKNPHMFAEAVVVDSDKKNFCQTDFTRDGSDGRYVRVKHNRFAWATGKFDPGKGDLVFAKSGEVLGIMVNNDYAFHVQNLGSRIRLGSRTPLGKSFDGPKTTEKLATLGKTLRTLSQKFR